MNGHVPLVLCTVFAGMGSFDPAIGGTNSPITVVEVQSRTNVPQISAAYASAEAVGIVGSDAYATCPARLVQYEDRASLGPAPVGTGWLLRGSVQVSRGDNVTNVPVTAILDAATGDLVAAYTDSIGEWPVPVYKDDMLAQVSKEAGWVMGSVIPDSMRSNVAEVIDAIWRDNGIDPTEAGQIIVRPRSISPRFPARMVDGKLVPVRGTERVWIVQVCGRKWQMPRPRSPEGEKRDEYDTERFMELKDGSLEFASAFYLP